MITAFLLNNCTKKYYFSTTFLVDQNFPFCYNISIVRNKEPQMNFEQAMQVVQQYQKDWALPGLLETLMQMNSDEDDLTYIQRRASRVVFNEMGKLFAPASPALTKVVVAVKGTSSSAGKPIAEACG